MTESAGTIGPATDRNNAPVEDPTRNVQALNDAGLERQDALRNLESRHFREILTLRSDCAEKVSRLEASLAGEKFAGVEQRATLVENHRLELKGDSEKALTAALSAADKAVDKAVGGLKELILNNAQISQAVTAALGDKVEDLKANVSILVNQRIGATEQRVETRAITGAQVAILGVLVAVVALLVAVLLRG